MIKVFQDIIKKQTIDIDSFNCLSIEEKELIKDLFTNGLIEEALKFVDLLEADGSWELLKKSLHK